MCIYDKSPQMPNKNCAKCPRITAVHPVLGIATKIARTHLKKIVIPHKIKPDFLAELRRMNITAAALFPGVDGLGRSIADLTSLGM